jgi:hypothetical protein
VNQPKLADVNIADKKNAMISYALAGGTLALALGLAGGAARRSAMWALVGGVLGLVLGAAAGAGTTAAVVPTYQKLYDAQPDVIAKEMTVPLLVHAAIWAAMGAAAALALGIGAGARWKIVSVVLGGVIGGAIAGGIYEVVGALAWADGKTFQPIAGAWQPRLLASLAGPLLVTFVAVTGLVSEPRRPKKPVAATPEVVA